MDTLNISIPPELHQWLDQQVALGHYKSIDDCIQQLIQQNQSIENLRRLLDEGEQSGVSDLTITQIIEREFNNGQVPPIQ